MKQKPSAPIQKSLNCQVKQHLGIEAEDQPSINITLCFKMLYAQQNKVMPEPIPQSEFPVQKYVPKNHLVLSFPGISPFTYKGFRVHVSSRGCISISVIFRVFLFNPFEKKVMQPSKLDDAIPRLSTTT